MILIKEMEMPTSCNLCPFCRKAHCMIMLEEIVELSPYTQRLPNCPLMEVESYECSSKVN